MMKFVRSVEDLGNLQFKRISLPVLAWVEQPKVRISTERDGKYQGS
jgi:hypothetical protein